MIQLANSFQSAIYGIPEGTKLVAFNWKKHSIIGTRVIASTFGGKRVGKISSGTTISKDYPSTLEIEHLTTFVDDIQYKILEGNEIVFSSEYPMFTEEDAANMLKKLLTDFKLDEKDIDQRVKLFIDQYRLEKLKP